MRPQNPKLVGFAGRIHGFTGGRMHDNLSEHDALTPGELATVSPAEITTLPEFKTTPPAKLSDKVVLFCKWYALIGNAKLAYERSGHVSVRPAQQANKLMGREIVQAFVSALRGEILTGKAAGSVGPDWIKARYSEIAAVRLPDLMEHDEVEGPRWKGLSELTDVQRAAIASISLSHPKIKDKEGVTTLGPARITGYTLYPKPDALAALARFEGMNKDTVKHDHAHTVRGKVQGIFKFVAGHSDQSETVARLRKQHGRAGARVIEHDPTPSTPDVRPLRIRRGT